MWRGGGNHAIAAASQHRHHQMADGLIVLHHQDGFAAALRECRAGGSLDGRWRDVGRAWQVDGKRTAFARFARYADVSSALPDDAVNGGESQASAAVDILSGEEGLEDMELGLLVHA